MSGTAAAAAAAAKRREEEELTKYNSDDLNGWEFKIVRSNTKKFKNYEIVQQICAEESKAGWEMVEKFDNSRIRFKRRIEKRAQDNHLESDPYRTLVGVSEVQIAGIGLGALTLVGLIAALIANLSGG